MVTAPPPRRRFLRDTSGIAMTEAMIVLPLLILVFAVMVEFTAMVFQWNQVVKAMQVGARRAAVSDPLTNIDALEDYTGMPTAGPITGAPVSVTCGAGASPCDATELGRLYYGSDGVCTGYDPNGAVGVCDIAWFVPQSSLRITYTRSNLGYSGRPYGPVVTVTLETRNLYFDFFLLDRIMSLFRPLGFPAGIPVPTHPVAVTSEDLCNEKTCS